MSNFLTPNEVAEACAVHPSTVRRWRQEGVGPAYFKTPGGWSRYPRAEFEQWYAENMTLKVAA